MLPRVSSEEKFDNVRIIQVIRFWQMSTQTIAKKSNLLLKAETQQTSKEKQKQMNPSLTEG